MRVVFVQLKVVKVIDATFVSVTVDDKKIETDEIAKSSIILHLSDNDLCKIDDVKTAL